MKRTLFNELLTNLTPDERKYMTSETEGIADVVDHYYEDTTDADENEIIENIKTDMISSLSDEVQDEMSFETTQELKDWIDYLKFMYGLISKIENFLE